MSNQERIRPQVRRAWYDAGISEFLRADPLAVVGELFTNGDLNNDINQKNAWLAEIELLKSCLTGLTGSIYLEFNIPRMGRRIDVVLLIGSVIFVLEFKVGEDEFQKSAVEQVWDYALDLKNFHEGSHRAAIVPILVLTTEGSLLSPNLKDDGDGVFRPISIRQGQLRKQLDAITERIAGTSLDGATWSSSSYKPTPTIIEAARALYSNHSVDAIARSDADAQNLAVTSGRIEAIVQDARKNRRKVICFVTGVPGAGKTLVGLNVATRRTEADSSAHAVFLSGNGPLVKVLREALTRDEVARQRAANKKVRKGVAGESIKAFIQNVHHFRDDALQDPTPPDEHIAIFDEAQRAWNVTMTANFMRRKKGRDGFDQSEPEFLISCMDRHADWAVIVCLVGGGQEINTGEAGIDAWLDAINDKFPSWNTYISSRLTDSEYAAGKSIELVRERGNTNFDDALHLSVSMRSFRAENVSYFVKALLDCEKDVARDTLKQFAERYPIAVTRDLVTAKKWVRDHARGSERYGLMASSKAQRLKPHAIDIRVNVDPVHWFLNGRDDPRSSYYLEDAATEFQVQGLEVDWACVTWDGDLRFDRNGWRYFDFRGSRWQNVRSEENRRYLLNAYRVLLTRARQGMVLFVPPGDAEDATRLPEYYDATFEYLSGLGIPAA